MLSQKSTDDSKNNLENIVETIKDKVPNAVKIKTSEVDDQELQNKIKETVGKILTDEEINSIVQLRNISSVNGKSITPTTTTISAPTSSNFETETFKSNSSQTLNVTKTPPTATETFTKAIEIGLETSSPRSTTIRLEDAIETFTKTIEIGLETSSPRSTTIRLEDAIETFTKTIEIGFETSSPRSTTIRLEVEEELSSSNVKTTLAKSTSSKPTQTYIESTIRIEADVSASSNEISTKGISLPLRLKKVHIFL